MASNSDNRENLNPMERQLIATGRYIVVNHYLPDRISVDKPNNPLFLEKLSRLENHDPDQTMTPKDKMTRNIVIAFLIFVGVAGSLFSSQYKDRDFHAFKPAKPAELTQVQGLAVDEATILSTYSADDPPLPAGSKVFGNRRVRVGDRVGYGISDNNLIDIDGKDRNFNTPLVISGTAVKEHGTRSFGERLPILANTSAYVYLERDVMTGNLNAPVSAVNYLDVKSNGKVVLPKGSRLIGQCRRVNGNRIEMSFDGVISSDGREYSVDGVALGDDNITGVAGILNRNLPKKTGNLFASSLLDATSQTLNLTGDSFGTIFAGNMADRTSDSLDNVIDESSDRSGATIRIPANTRFKILF